ncbi:hypothetical protein C2E23DRAFT_889355 [Lenzites betulinus]|nr:hypothetical protein C2E23DRAFT_889355 [Lenzites betulinus]
MRDAWSTYSMLARRRPRLHEPVGSVLRRQLHPAADASRTDSASLSATFPLLRNASTTPACAADLVLVPGHYRRKHVAFIVQPPPPRLRAI